MILYFFLQNFSFNSIAYIYLLVKFLFCLFFCFFFHVYLQPVMVNKDVYYYSDIDTCLAQRTTHVLVIAHSLLLDLAYGTVCQPSCESRTLHSDNFDEHSKRIYLVTDSAEYQFFSVRPVQIRLLTYLLTYLRVTFANEAMFYPAFVCLSLCMSVGLLASCLINAWAVSAHPCLSQQAPKWAVTNQLSGRGKAAT